MALGKIANLEWGANYSFAAIIYLTVSALLFDRQTLKNLIGVGVVWGLLITIFCYFSKFLPDYSYDGNWYHQSATLALKHGWNPFRLSLKEWIDQLPSLSGWLNKDLWHNANVEKWSGHYSYGTWLIESYLMSLGFTLDEAKGWGLALGVSNFVLLSRTVLPTFEIPRWQAIFLATVAVLNPVYLVQIPTYYVDGILYQSFLTCFLSLFLVQRDPDNSIGHLLFMIAGLFLANVKFTGLVYFGTLVLIYCGLFFKSFANRRLNWSRTIIGIIGVIYLWHPYVTSTIRNAHPFFPLNEIDLMTPHMDHSIRSMGRFQRFGYAQFLKTDEEKAILKLPGRWLKGETTASRAPDTKYGGFGPLFGLTIVLFLFFILKNALRLNQMQKWYLGILFLLTFINPHAWWARYVPFVWLIPTVVFLAKTPQDRYSRGIANLMAFTFIATLILYIGNAWFHSLRELRRNERALSSAPSDAETLIVFDKAMAITMCYKAQNEWPLKIKHCHVGVASQCDQTLEEFRYGCVGAN